ncbi:hypothetical protein [Paraburkholderia jirisanensis]
MLKSKIHEKKAFLAYHALESTGSALAILKGLPVGASISHPKKLQNFVKAAKQHGDKKLEIEVVKLVTNVSALRNRLLYPEDHSGGIHTHLPQHRITIKEAEELYRRVEGVVTSVEKIALSIP